ncbi:hypothetical protein GCM10010227_44540 [Streptomyces gougerotii]|uniref:Uncharacterized protein n=1 Tax=Streptomyces gougerotii TaxID=53448 RepID=A0A8H9HSH5_9ACTN|nr:hypothetical protein GCM10010227_44540 [Streptomyces gougerotii]
MSKGGGPCVPRVSCLPSLSIRPAPWPAGPSVPVANLLPHRPVAPYCAGDLRKRARRWAPYGAGAHARRTARRGARACIGPRTRCAPSAGRVDAREATVS